MYIWREALPVESTNKNRLVISYACYGVQDTLYAKLPSSLAYIQYIIDRRQEAVVWYHLRYAGDCQTPVSDSSTVYIDRRTATMYVVCIVFRIGKVWSEPRHMLWSFGFISGLGLQTRHEMDQDNEESGSWKGIDWHSISRGRPASAQCIIAHACFWHAPLLIQSTYIIRCCHIYDQPLEVEERCYGSNSIRLYCETYIVLHKCLSTCDIA